MTRENLERAQKVVEQMGEMENLQQLLASVTNGQNSMQIMIGKNSLKVTLTSSLIDLLAVAVDNYHIGLSKELKKL